MPLCARSIWNWRWGTASGPRTAPHFTALKDGPEQTRKSPARRIGTPIPDSGRIGNRGFPVSRFRPSRESGIDDSPDFPKKSGNRGNRESDFLSDEYQLQWTRNILSREYHASAFTGSMRLLFRVRDSEREHAAVSASDDSDSEHQAQWTQHILRLSLHSAASFML